MIPGVELRPGAEPVEFELGSGDGRNRATRFVEAGLADGGSVYPAAYRARIAPKRRGGGRFRLSEYKAGALIAGYRADRDWRDPTYPWFVVRDFAGSGSCACDMPVYLCDTVYPRKNYVRVPDREYSELRAAFARSEAADFIREEAFQRGGELASSDIWEAASYEYREAQRRVAGVRALYVDVPRTPAPLKAGMLVRCRTCRSCLRAKQREWERRANLEWFATLHRTIEWFPGRKRPGCGVWFFTGTYAPSIHAEAQWYATSELAKRGIKFVELPERAQWDALMQVYYGPRIDKFLARLRKHATFRYLMVAEPHRGGGLNDGRLHIHCLFFEASADKDRRLTYERVRHAWKYQPGAGFMEFKLKGDDPSVDARRLIGGVVAYLCKYMTKSLSTRIRASQNFGYPEIAMDRRIASMQAELGARDAVAEGEASCGGRSATIAFEKRVPIEPPQAHSTQSPKGESASEKRGLVEPGGWLQTPGGAPRSGGAHRAEPGVVVRNVDLLSTLNGVTALGGSQDLGGSLQTGGTTVRHGEQGFPSSHEVNSSSCSVRAEDIRNVLPRASPDRFRCEEPVDASRAKDSCEWCGSVFGLTELIPSVYLCAVCVGDDERRLAEYRRENGPPAGKPIIDVPGRIIDRWRRGWKDDP